MNEQEISIKRWNGPMPSEESLRRIYATEGLQPYVWSNRPGDTYSVHRHPYTKVLRVIRGTIRFDLPERHDSVELGAGDELILSSGVAHGAVVGLNGVACLEAHRSSA
jgi:quercetin dioxygenase-like cupin family protein